MYPHKTSNTMKSKRLTAWARKGRKKGMILIYIPRLRTQNFMLSVNTGNMIIRATISRGEEKRERKRERERKRGKERERD